MKHLISLNLAMAFTAFLALPISVEATGSIIFATGLALLVQQDYRSRPSIRLPARAPARRARTPFRAPALAAAPHRLAA
jgi:hypothetical protein